MSDSYFANNTETVVLNATAATVSPAVVSPSRYRIVSDRRFHILIDRTGNPATTNEWFEPAECPAIFAVNPGDTISVIKADGETDGTVWISKQ